MYGDDFESCLGIAVDGYGEDVGGLESVDSWIE